MRKQIIIYYKKSRQKECIYKRVITQEDNNYSIVNYWKQSNNIKEYSSNLKLSENSLNKYILQCRKENNFDHIEIQNVL